jgi:adenylate cyclase
MAVFGAPLSSGRDPLNAVESAVTMRRMLGALNLRRRERGQPEIRIGMGVATGEVVAGTIGSPKRMDYTVIGDCVNVASRLQALTKTYGVGVLVCEATAAAIGTALPLRELDTVRVRGRRRPSRIFQVVTDDRPLPADTAQAYQCGLGELQRGDFAAATQAFQRAAQSDPFDAPSAVMLERALALAAAPPGNWDGAWPAQGSA